MYRSGFLISALLLPVLAAMMGSYWLYQYDIPQQMDDRLFGYLLLPPVSLLRTSSQFLLHLGVQDIFMVYRHATKWSVRLHRMLDPNLVSPLIVVRDELYDGVPVKVYGINKDNSQSNSVPVSRMSILFIHGGGFTISSPEEYEPIFADIILKTGVAIVAIDYRLAPLHPYPHPVEDCWKAVRYFLSQGYRQLPIDADPHQVLFMGDSAGGMAVLRVTLQLLMKAAQKENETFPLPKAVILFYPMTQFLTIDTPSFLENEWNFFIPRYVVAQVYLSYFQGGLNENDWNNFIANNFSTPAIRQRYAEKYQLPELANHRALSQAPQSNGDPTLVARFQHFYTDFLNSPLFADENLLQQFPDVFLLTCEYDILRDDGLMLARRFTNAFTQSKSQLIHHHLNTFHGVMNFHHYFANVSRAYATLIDFIKQKH